MFLLQFCAVAEDAAQTEDDQDEKDGAEAETYADLDDRRKDGRDDDIADDGKYAPTDEGESEVAHAADDGIIEGGFAVAERTAEHADEQ